MLTPEDLDDLLPRFFGLSRREAEMVAVSIRPVEAPPRREVVTATRAAPAATLPVFSGSRGDTSALQTEPRPMLR